MPSDSSPNFFDTVHYHVFLGLPLFFPFTFPFTFPPNLVRFCLILLVGPSPLPIGIRFSSILCHSRSPNDISDSQTSPLLTLSSKLSVAAKGNLFISSTSSFTTCLVSFRLVIDFKNKPILLYFYTQTLAKLGSNL